MFVRLTYAGSRPRPMWVRAASIVSIVPGWLALYGGSEKETHIITTAGEFDVDETPEQILKLIHEVDLVSAGYSR